MSAAKRITGDYTIRVRDPNTVTGLGKVYIDGDLIVIGASSTVESTDTKINDKIITLNAGEVGPTISNTGGSLFHETPDYAFAVGIEVDRGTSPKPMLRWAQDGPGTLTGNWELSHDGVNFAPIITSVGGLEVVLDTTPQLGGDLDVNGFGIISVDGGDIKLTADGAGQIKMETPLSLKDLATPLLPTTGYNKVFSRAAHGGGGSGLFFTNDSASDELISRNMAIVYSMIF